MHKPTPARRDRRAWRHTTGLLAGMATVAMAAVTAQPSHAAPVNLVVNGDFESTAGLDGWLLNGATAQLGRSVSPNPATFGQYAFFNSSSTELSGITQVLDTVPGARYSVSFWVGLRVARTSSFAFSWDGDTVLGLLDASPFSMRAYSYTLTAVDSQTVLSLQSLAARGGFWNVDNISVVALDPPEDPTGVPEPATMALVGAALLGLRAVRRRSRA